MPWQLQPLIWPIVIATLAMLAIPRPAHPTEPSEAIKRACTADVKRLCPREYLHRHADGGAGIGTCMKAHAFSISGRCIKAWLFEHPEDKK
jgi:hypothetical protein